MSHSALVSFPVVIEFDVGWSDMDSYDHVSNLVYFRYFQDARIEYLARVGWLESKRTSGLGPIVKSTAASYRKPVKYPDRVWVGARVIEALTDRVTFEHKLVSRAWGQVACEGTAVLVSYDYRNECKAPLPDGVRRAMVALEGQTE
ncbi:thioesterase family protein [Gemmata sp. JC717]|uniref:acyl-CoA thioesterase n=1 Tax=Gemmata algarum TaxID=2975278 RepID=UPI0021BB3FA7|nr:thioesterase family protein [Gemmata algarum]MDY3553434.1 thioesterase family protein [Gemmata algarum]